MGVSLDGWSEPASDVRPFVWSDLMRLPSVQLLSAHRLFASVKVGKTADRTILRIVYTDGKVVDIDLFDGWQGVMIGTSVFDVQVTKYGVRIKRASGSIRFFHPSIVW